MEKNYKNLKQVKGGKKILRWIDECPNDLFSALTFQGGNAHGENTLDDFRE